MTFMKTFDFSDLSTIEINAEMEGFQPRFDNTLALTAYRQQTLILTREGQAVILNCRLQECLSRFRKENGICRHEPSRLLFLGPLSDPGNYFGALPAGSYSWRQQPSSRLLHGPPPRYL